MGLHYDSSTPEERAAADKALEERLAKYWAENPPKKKRKARGNSSEKSTVAELMSLTPRPFVQYLREPNPTEPVPSEASPRLRPYAVLVATDREHFGWSECGLEDQFVKHKGLQIAFGRALKSKPIDKSIHTAMTSQQDKSRELHLFGLISEGIPTDEHRDDIFKGLIEFHGTANSYFDQIAKKADKKATTAPPQATVPIKHAPPGHVPSKKMNLPGKKGKK